MCGSRCVACTAEFDTLAFMAATVFGIVFVLVALVGLAGAILVIRGDLKDDARLRRRLTALETKHIYNALSGPQEASDSSWNPGHPNTLRRSEQEQPVANDCGRRHCDERHVCSHSDGS
jgi:hypothetical protein